MTSFLYSLKSELNRRLTLLSAMIDNHIYHGNELEIEKVVWKRCVDLNDRQLRKVNTGLSKENKIKC